MAVVETDDFNRADSSNVGTKWSETGWSDHAATGDVVQITSNKMAVVNASGYNNAICTTSMGSVEQYHQAVYTWTGSPSIGPVLRASGTTTPSKGYQVNWRPGSNDAYVVARTNGYDTSHFTNITGLTGMTSGCTLKATVSTISGSQVDVALYLNGTLQGTYNDTDAARITTGNYVGFNCPSANVQFDDFEGGTLGAAAATFTPKVMWFS